MAFFRVTQIIQNECTGGATHFLYNYNRRVVPGPVRNKERRVAFQGLDHLFVRHKKFQHTIVGPTPTQTVSLTKNSSKKLTFSKKFHCMQQRVA
jgi:hypothetical protein